MSLKYALLGLLSYQPMAGYDLKTIFDESINHFWTASTSQIYRDLGELEKEGFTQSHVESQEGRPDRKVYTVTEEGRHAFITWLDDFPVKLHSAVREDFLVRVFFGSRISSEDLRFQFQKYRKEMQASIEHMKEAVEGTSYGDYPEEEQFFWRMTEKLGYKIAVASEEWARECIREIDRFMTEQAVKKEE